MIWDLANLMVCWTLILFALVIKKIKIEHALVLALLSLIPFCLNNVIFDASYMPDQFTYLRMLTAIREFHYDPSIYNSRVTEASCLYSFLPLPFVETVNSLGFFNKFLMILIFIWCASVLKLRGWILWFLLLYPSLILYSSLGLRDMMICSFMLIALWSTIKNRFGLMGLSIGILALIKIQNALLVAFFCVLYLLDKYLKIHFDKKKFFLFFAGTLGLVYATFPLLLPKIEYYRIRMFLEDGGVRTEYKPLTGFFDFIVQGSEGIFRSFFCPLPWECDTILQYLQSLENILISALIAVFTWKSFLFIPKKTLLWLFFLSSAMLMYGLIVSNVGTMVRYKLPFIVVYFIFLSYERQKFEQESLRSLSFKVGVR